MGGRQYTAQEMIDAIHEARGFLTVAADKLGCSRRTVYRYMRDYPTVQEALDDTREKRHDFVEGKLMAAINNDNIAAIIFYLKTQCKQRGYIERHEHTGAEGGPIVVVNWEDGDDTD